MFVQFLHDQLLKLTQPGLVRPSKDQVQAARKALHWVTFLSRDPLLIPTVDLVQSGLAAELMHELAVLGRERYVTFVGSSVAVEQIQRSKFAHFNRTSLMFPWEDRVARERLLRFENLLTARETHTTTDLRMRWMGDVGRIGSSGSGVADTPLTGRIREAASLLGRSPTDRKFAHALAMLPRRLEDHAFLWAVVEDLGVFPFRTTGTPRERLELGLAWHWLVSHLEEYRTTLPVAIPRIGAMDFGVSRTHPANVVNLWRYGEAFRVLGLLDAFEALTLSEVLTLRGSPRIISFREGLLAELYTDLGRGGPNEALYEHCELVRTAALSAQGPVEALTAAAAAAVGTSRSSRPTQSDTAAPQIRVGVVIALVEELSLMRDTIEGRIGPLRPDQSGASGHTVYRPDRPWMTAAGVEIDIFFSVVGKGQERAGTATAVIITDHKPHIVANVGIAGALSSDAELGDIIIGSQVVSYLANSKAVPKEGTDTFEFQPAGDAALADRYLADRASQLDLSDPQDMAGVRARLHERAAGSLLQGNVREDLRFQVLCGPVASGPTVAAAPAFKRWVLSSKRDFLAIEMESSGAAVAAEATGMLRRIRFVALRGISDLADDKKGELEASTKGAVRELAAAGPIETLFVLLDNLPAEAAISTEPD